MVHRQKLVRITLSIALLLIVAVASASANLAPPKADLDASVGVRATGMGGAYTALSSDVTGLLYNPAGIGQKFLDVTIGGSTSTPEAFYNVGELVLANPDDIDFSIIKESVNMNGLAGASLGPLAVAVVVDGDFQDHGNDYWTATLTSQVVGGLGFRIARVPLGAGELRLGFAAHAIDARKIDYLVLDDDNATELSKLTGKGLRLSAGAMATITPWVSLGVTAENLAGKIDWYNAMVSEDDIVYTEELEPLFTGGIAVKVPFLGITLAADADDKNNIRYGAETSLLFNLISLRVGQKQSPDQDPVLTAGLSMNLGPLSAGVAAEGVNVDNKTAERVLAEASIRF